jgi:hypothetical protein
MLHLYDATCEAGLSEEDFAAVVKVSSSTPLKTEPSLRNRP